jgi:hypothetical protein
LRHSAPTFSQESRTATFEVALKVLSQSAGWAAVICLLALAYVFTQAKLMLDVSYMRKHMVSRKDLELHKAKLNEKLARDYVTKEQLGSQLAAISHASGGNGKALGV